MKERKKCDWIRLHKKFYTDRQMSIQRVSALAGVSAMTLHRHWTGLGLPIRGHGDTQHLKDLRRKDEVVYWYSRYLKGELNLKEVAKRLGVGQIKIYKLLNLFSLPLNLPAGYFLSVHKKNMIVEEYKSGESQNRLSKRHGVTCGTIRKVLDKKNIVVRDKRESIHNGLKRGHYSGKHYNQGSGDNDFFKMWNERSAWVYGIILSDGSISPTEYGMICTIASNDKDLLQNIVTIMSLDVRCIHPKNDKRAKNNCYTLSIANKEIIKDLLHLGVESRKSKKVKMPENIPKEYVRDFIRGYFDGDGSISLTTTGYKFSMASQSKDILLAISRFFYEQAGVCIPCRRISLSAVNDINDKSTLSVCPYTNKYGSTIYQIQTVCQENLKRLYDYFYDGTESILYLMRKRVLFDRVSD